jgi:sortase (surface protein transpeptidase)
VKKWLTVLPQDLALLGFLDLGAEYYDANVAPKDRYFQKNTQNEQQVLYFVLFRDHFFEKMGIPKVLVQVEIVEGQDNFELQKGEQTIPQGCRYFF